MSTPVPPDSPANRRRHERAEEGAERGCIPYGKMGETARLLTAALKNLKIDRKASDWGHQGKDKKR